ncbi:-hydroxytryptamine receptor 3A-like [Xyrichtys novacula]|nr:-hydroxytryptamine receptor 3A-like [Xyrichtys novacula]
MLEEVACNKSTWDIITYLKLDQNKDQFAMTRPAKNHLTPTKVYLDLILYAILQVQEKEQKFNVYVWLDMIWKHYQIRWDPNQFCNITSVAIPTKLLWQPDITIEERTEKSKDTESPFVHVNYNGWVLKRNNMVLVTTCVMKVYKFPFDTQSCSLTFKSIIFDEKQVKVVKYAEQNSTTALSKQIMHTQSDWIFINITSNEMTEDNFEITQRMVTYTINMKRRYLLYMVNFLLPILMFLGLDLASFMMSDTCGEKLGFQVTVLLAVTVMQLILNEILPSSSDRIPLIAIYCVGIFGLMMLSLLETIFVMYLIEKDSANKDQSPAWANTIEFIPQAF